MRHAQIFTTGYQANLGVISGLCGPDDTVFARHREPRQHLRRRPAERRDRLHVPPQLGVRSAAQAGAAAGSAPLPGRHRRALLDQRRRGPGSGDRRRLRRQAGAYLMVDEAHSFGAYGARGLGCAEDQGVLDRVDFIVGTFSKTLAGIGGFCVSNHDELRLLHFAARPYVFTASASPASVAGVEAALQRAGRGDPSAAAKLWDNVRRARAGLVPPGSTSGRRIANRAGADRRRGPDGPVLADAPRPRPLREHRAAARQRPPMPACCGRAIRRPTSAAEIDRAVAIFAEVGRSLSIIPTPA